MAETAIDIAAFSSILREVYLTTGDAIDAETAAMAEAFASGHHNVAHELHASAWPSRHIRRLLASYKAWFYFTRIYQDLLYGAISRSIAGVSGRRMNAVLNEQNPVRLLLDVLVPDYVPWFSNFRDERNALKDGTAAHTRGGEGPTIPVDYGLGFTGKDDRTHVIRLRDLTRALEMSAAVALVAAERLSDHGITPRRPQGDSA